MSERGKVLIAPVGMHLRKAPYLDRLRHAGFELVPNTGNRSFNEDEMVALIPDLVATLAGGEPYSARVLEAARKLKLVARFGVGWDKVDVAAATRKGIPVAMAFGTNHDAVAEYTFALMLALACNVLPNHAKVAGGNWGATFHASLADSTIGIIGLGRIGQAVAGLGRAFAMRVVAYDPAPDMMLVKAQGIELMSLDQLLGQSDFVSLHAPLEAATRHLINAARLRQMKPSAFLINTARGGLIDEEALTEALVQKRIAGAGLDVFGREPPVGSPLLALPNVVMSPHAASHSARAEVLCANRCIDSILAVVVDGASPGAEYLLNPEVMAGR